MWALVVILHVLVCTVLILIVLIQRGRGSDLASAFGGGGSQTLFGPTGAASLLNKATTVGAILYMSTSLVLALFSGGLSGKGSVVEKSGLPFDQVTESRSPVAETGTPGGEQAPGETAQGSAESPMQGEGPAPAASSGGEAGPAGDAGPGQAQNAPGTDARGALPPPPATDGAPGEGRK